jgi:hypothetical protein
LLRRVKTAHSMGGSMQNNAAPDSAGTGGQTGKGNANEKATTGMDTNGSKRNGMSGSANGGMHTDSMQKDKSPASRSAGIEQEK